MIEISSIEAKNENLISNRKRKRSKKIANLDLTKINSFNITSKHPTQENLEFLEECLTSAGSKKIFGTVKGFLPEFKTQKDFIIGPFWKKDLGLPSISLPKDDSRDRKTINSKPPQLLNFDKFLEIIYPALTSTQTSDSVLRNPIAQRKSGRSKGLSSKVVRLKALNSSSKKRDKAARVSRQNLYDIDNFVIQRMVSKSSFEPKQTKRLTITTPQFREIDIFLNEVSVQNPSSTPLEIEELADCAYFPYHQKCETRENNFRIGHLEKQSSFKKTPKVKKGEYPSTAEDEISNGMEQKTTKIVANQTCCLKFRIPIQNDNSPKV